MTDDPLAPLAGRYWRMCDPRWHDRPFESGSHITGGRWNPVGVRALYLSADYNVAIREMHQDLVRPGTLIAFDIAARAIADLSRADPAITGCLWRDIYAIRQGVPPTWALAAQLIDAGAEGAIVPSVLMPGGRNLVLWRWRDAREPQGDGAALSLLDPGSALTRR